MQFIWAKALARSRHPWARICDLFGGFVGEHVITRSVRDSAAVLDITSVRTPGEPYYAPDLWGSFVDAMAAPRRGLKVGIGATLDDCDVAPEVTAVVEKIGALLEDIGHHVQYSQPARIRPSFMAHYAAGTAWVLDYYWPRRTGRPVTQSDVESTTWGLAEMGRKASASDYMAAREDVQLFARDVASWWTSGFDLLLSPTMPQLPPKADAPARLTSMGFAMPSSIASGRGRLAVLIMRPRSTAYLTVWPGTLNVI